MPTNLINKAVIKELAAKAAGLDNDRGDARLKEVFNRLLYDVMVAIDDLDVSMNEFWAAVGYIGEAAKANELGLVVPGTALEHFLDLRLDEAERRAGLAGGTTRTIEGPLYVAGAPLTKGETRLDDGTDEGEILLMEGQVFDIAGNPVAGAIVDVWHANSFGFYSFFGPPQSPYNLRRRIETDREGRYRFRSIMPSGYGCPPGSNTRTCGAAVKHADVATPVADGPALGWAKAAGFVRVDRYVPAFRAGIRPELATARRSRAARALRRGYSRCLS